MPITRSSSRKATGATIPTATPTSTPAKTGTKRKADSSSSASSSPAKVKKAKASKKQKTIEQTLPATPVKSVNGKKSSKASTQATAAKNGAGKVAAKDDNKLLDTEMKDAEIEKTSLDQTKDAEKVDSQVSSDVISSVKDETNANSNKVDQDDAKGQANGIDESPAKDENLIVSNEKEVATHESVPAHSNDEKTNGTASITGSASTNTQTDEVNDSNTKSALSTEPGHYATESEKVQSDSIKEEQKSDETSSKPAKDDAVEVSIQRDESTPSSILEKGIIYFFFRGRIGIDEPSDVNDIARSYIVLRPLPRGAKLTDGNIGEQDNLRVLALPKKVLPRGTHDRFMVFVDKAKVSLEELKKDFLSASDYDTKTAGTRHSPAATPIGEGVYALTSTGRETHLAYILTTPKELSEVQKDIGLEAKGSWATSVKNPQYPGPAQAQLAKAPEFPQE